MPGADAAPSLLARAHARVRQWFARLVAAHASPGRLAAAVLVGAVAGCTPFFGLHLWMCIALASLLRLNHVTVYAAANISIPPLVPFLGFASVQVGERLLHRRWLPMSLAEFRALGEHGDHGWAGPMRQFFDWLAGTRTPATVAPYPLTAGDQVLRMPAGAFRLPGRSTSFIEVIRFAAANHLCVDLDYVDERGRRNRRDARATRLSWG